ncbi:glycosyltransferase, partial [bacterium]|nr:glycosyltransferase [bacterium]
MFLKRTKGIIVTSKKIKEFFLEKNIPSEKILVAPNGVDIQMFDVGCSKFEAREKINLPQDKKIVLYTGHLYSWKGAQTLADASRYLIENTEIYFVGGTKKDIKNFKLQTSNFKLNIVGHRPHSEIPYWLRAADVLILPDLAVKDILKYGASPMKMFEYM